MKRIHFCKFYRPQSQFLLKGILFRTIAESQFCQGLTHQRRCNDTWRYRISIIPATYIEISLLALVQASYHRYFCLLNWQVNVRWFFFFPGHLSEKFLSVILLLAQSAALQEVNRKDKQGRHRRPREIHLKMCNITFRSPITSPVYVIKLLDWFG